MRSLFVFAFVGVVAGGCTKRVVAPPAETNDVYLTSKPVAEIQRPAIIKNPTDLTQCRERIKSIMCQVTQSTSETEDIRSRECVTGGEKYAVFFEGHFDRSPAFIQKMYCYLDFIWIEKAARGTAFASPNEGIPGHITSGAIGIRQEVLDQPLPSAVWLSWKEETSFGGPTTTSGESLGLIRYQTNKPDFEFFLDYALNHEFGHLFDFANKLGGLRDCDWKQLPDGNWEVVGKCDFEPNSWGSISWVNREQPKDEDNFNLRSEVCFYFCNGNFLARENAKPLFEGMLNSSFQSTYASMQYTEDFAESFATYIAHEYLDYQYGVTIEDKFFDLSAHYRSESMSKKRDYVRNFLSGKYKYPGDD